MIEDFELTPLDLRARRRGSGTTPSSRRRASVWLSQGLSLSLKAA
jgi:hypothetical protein